MIEYLMNGYALVTGSTKGIGRAIGESLLREGYFVVFNYSSDEKSASELKKKHSGEGERYCVIKQRLETKTDIESFVSSCLKISNVFDVVVCNVGCTDRSSWDEMSWEAWERVMNVNINAPAHMLRLLDAHISKGGSVVFTGSDMGIYAHAMSIPYSVSKGAIHTLAKSLVKVYAERGIRVNAVAPGFVDTPWQMDKPDEVRRSIENKVALKRFADPLEVADMVMSIIGNGYVNGSVIQIDGGYCYK